MLTAILIVNVLTLILVFYGRFCAKNEFLEIYAQAKVTQALIIKVSGSEEELEIIDRFVRNTYKNEIDAAHDKASSFPI